MKRDARILSAITVLGGGPRGTIKDLVLTPAVMRQSEILHRSAATDSLVAV
jgi:hypothetical protein